MKYHSTILYYYNHWNYFPLSLALQEAICQGEPNILKLVLKYRDRQRISNRVAAIPELLDLLKTVSTSITWNYFFAVNSDSYCFKKIYLNLWLLILIQTKDFYIEMKWEFTSWSTLNCYLKSCLYCRNWL